MGGLEARLRLVYAKLRARELEPKSSEEGDKASRGASILIDLDEMLSKPPVDNEKKKELCRELVGVLDALKVHGLPQEELDKM